MNLVLAGWSYVLREDGVKSNIFTDDPGAGLSQTENPVRKGRGKRTIRAT